jgi:hypothetical protein
VVAVSKGEHHERLFGMPQALADIRIHTQPTQGALDSGLNFPLAQAIERAFKGQIQELNDTIVKVPWFVCLWLQGLRCSELAQSVF